MKYQDLLEVDYTAYDHVVDFVEKLDDIRLKAPRLEISSHYEHGTPVVDVNAEGRRKQYIDSYHLEGISRETFEERGYDLWVEVFETEFDSVTPLKEFADLNRTYRI